MPEVLTICGSLRTGSFNRALIKALPVLAPKEMSFHDGPPISDIPHFNSDLLQSGQVPQQVEAFAAAVRRADAVIIVSPEYNWTIPGTLKNALDWVSRVKDQPFAKKPVAIQSAAAGPLGGGRMQYHMRMTLTYLDAFIFGTPEVFVSFAQTKFDPQTLELTDENSKKAVAAQLTAFADFIGRLDKK